MSDSPLDSMSSSDGRTNGPSDLRVGGTEKAVNTVGSSPSTSDLAEAEILERARSIPCRHERADYVQHACADDSDLVERVLRKLHQQTPIGRQAATRGVAETGTRSDDPIVTPYAAAERGAQESPHAVEFPQPIIERYKILEEIGQGGMGTVYMAKQLAPVKRTVAIKVIKPGMDSREVVTRFEAERQALALMDHPNIAKVLDAGTTDRGLPYFVMELVRGVPVNQFCKSQNLGVSERLELFISICQAVQHAHQKGIIHRDLKPTNIMVTMHDDKPIVKVIDFGVAKALNQELTQKTMFTRFAQMIGTPLYMAPEQAQMNNLDVDTRSDVYSLGVILYELMTGTTPFQKHELAKLGVEDFRRVLKEREPDRPSSRISTLRGLTDTTRVNAEMQDVDPIGRSITRELDWIVMKALEKDRERRYQSAADFARDVKRFLANEPLAASPPSWTYQFGKWVRRNRISVGAACAVVAILTLISATSVWQFTQVREAWRASQIREQQANELLEASFLQQTMRAFEQSDLPKIKKNLASLPTEQVTHLAEEGDVQVPLRRKRSLAGFLKQVAYASPNERISVEGVVRDIALPPDREMLFSLEDDGTVRIVHLNPQGGIDLETPVQVFAHLDEKGEALAVSPDGDRLAVGTFAGRICVFDIRTREKIADVQPLDTGVESIVWSPDGQSLAVGARYSGVWVGDRNAVQKYLIPADSRNEAMLFSPDSSELLLSSRDSIEFYSVSNGKLQRSIAVSPLINPREFCFAGQDDEWLVTSDRFNQNLVVFHRESGKRLGVVPMGNAYPQSFAVMNGGRWVAALFPNGLVRLVTLSELDEGTVIGENKLTFSIVPDGAELEENARLRIVGTDGGRRLITAGPFGGLCEWDLQQLLPVQTLVPPGSLEAAFALRTSELAFFFRTVGNEPVRMTPKGLVERSSLSSGVPLSFQPHRYSRSVSRQQFIAIAGDRKIAVFDLRNAQTVGEIDSPFDQHRLVAVSPDGRSVAAQGDEEFCVWQSQDDWKTYERVVRMGILCDKLMAFTGASETLLLDDARKKVLALDLATRQVTELECVLDSDVCCGALSDSDRLFAIGVKNGFQLVRLDSQEIVFGVSDLPSTTATYFFDDERVLVTGHNDGTIQAWHLPTQQSLGTIFRPRTRLGNPLHIQPFPEGDRLLVCYESGGNITPVAIGVARE